MNITIITVGKPHLSFAKEGISEYLKRLQRFGTINLVPIKENKTSHEKILAVIASSYCILLDEGGDQYSSQELAHFLEKKKGHGVDLCFVIGGPDGHDPLVHARADTTLSLSQLTFPHDIATLLLTETLYRSLTILEGHPYHRN